MPVEILLLFVLGGITFLGYMIAINSHGPTKLAISYLMATIILIFTVYAFIQHVNSGLDSKKQEKYLQYEREKKKAEEHIRLREQSLIKSKKMMEAANTINGIINQGTGYASNMMNIEFKDFSVELDVLMGRANVMIKKVKELENEFEKLNNEKKLFPESIPTIQEALKQLSEAAKYYRLYFRAEDTAQEELRERILRQKARESYDLFKKASSQVASTM